MAVQPYNAKIEQILGSKMIGDSLWKIFYGVELEYEINLKSKIVGSYVETQHGTPKEILFKEPVHANSPVAHFICDAAYPLVKDFCIIKRDGSLANGIEIVSLPMSLDAHRTRWVDFFSKIADYGLVVRASCGMHVHVSRELLTTLQIGKILSFIHDPLNEPFLKMIAGRKPPVKYANLEESRKLSEVKKYSNANPELKYRYSAFNITGPATIEFRFFKCTDSLTRMLTNLEFCASIVAFTWPGKVGLSKNNLAGFLDFNYEYRKDYPNLYNFLVGKGFIEDIRKLKEIRKHKNAKPIKA